MSTVEKNKKNACPFFINSFSTNATSRDSLGRKLGGSAGNTAEVGFYEAKPEPPITDDTKPGGSLTDRFPQTGEEMAVWGVSALGIILVFIAVRKLAMKGGGSHE